MKKFKIIISVLCVILCILPFACMIFAKTDATSENRRLADMPKLVNEGHFNKDYLSRLGDYFGDHYAFRNQMVNADSIIQGDLFKVSNASTVVKGTDGWLYYADTLDDYMSKSKLTDKGIWNAARNISIMQSYVESKGAAFVFTIAPNKNSLYPDNMPYYYSGTYAQKKSVDSLIPQLNKMDINYVDLFSLFNDNNETLYLKRDSHWNNKGAMLVYNQLLDNLGVEHNDYTMVKAIREKKEIGDLNKMLYPVTAKPEWNYYYQFVDEFGYVTDTKSVEDAWIETSSQSNNGKLLMFRDSFGNTLIPFFAREFSSAYFSKGVPYSLESYINQYKPDYVIVEKVERNIDEFAFDPPVITVESDYKLKENAKKLDCASIEVQSYDGDSSYITIRGRIDEAKIRDYNDIYISISGKPYTAFTVSDDKGDNAFLAYINKNELADNSDISVIISSDEKEVIAATENINFSELI